MSRRIEHEEALIRAFILPQRQSRYLELLPKPKRRRDVTRELAHFKHVDMRFAVPIPPSQSGYAGSWPSSEAKERQTLLMPFPKMTSWTERNCRFRIHSRK